MTVPRHIYAIEPGHAFVDVLAGGILARVGPALDGDPLALARVTVLLPTRRAVRALSEAFLRASGGRALLLPRMVPLGDIDEDELLLGGGLAPDGEGFLGLGAGEDAAAALPPAIGGIARQLALAQLVLELGHHRWESAPDAGQAAELALELARLLDQMQTERVDAARLAEIAPEDANLAAHWQDILAFLEIVTGEWPRVQEAMGCIGPAERRNRLLEAKARVWRDAPPEDWVIAAGSTGSIPATADLLATVAGLERGCVVLPGLDRDLGEDDWESLPESHPQFGLQRLLAHLGVARAAVGDWAADWPAPADGPAYSAAGAARARILAKATALTPVARVTDAADATGALAWIECPSPAEEAAAIALRMRAVLETPEPTAALVTPDRDLARRVAAALRRWGIEVDDSAGRPLAGTPPAAFLRLLLGAVAEDFAPVALLACLNHPLAAAGTTRERFLARLRALDRLVLRGSRPSPGLGGLKARIGASRRACENRDDARASAVLAALHGLEGWVDAVAGCLAPLMREMDKATAGLPDLIGALIEAAEALAATDAASGADRLWRGEDGDALSAFIAEARDAAEGFPAMPGRRFPSLFDSLLAGRAVRPRFGAHARLFIWGPLEARLQRADVMILGGLNEGTWPLDPGNDPWMSRPMRRALCLALPERRIGLAAHDFAQGFAAPEVVLSRAHRVGGTPTVPSRWLLRLANVLDETALAEVKRRGGEWLARAQAIEHRLPAIEIARPAPRPALALRPRGLSVTEIETWQVNPYAVFARHVLGLDALDPVDADPSGPAERGTFVHDVMDDVYRDCAEVLALGTAGEIEAALLAAGRAAIEKIIAGPTLRAAWWPRFAAIARWVAHQEVARRATARPLATECRGRWTIETPGGPFSLRGRADRIDRLAAGDGLAIIDYKTGALPSAGDQQRGFAPQLPLLGAMAEDGAFEGVPAGPVAELAFWRLSGGREGGEAKPFNPGKGASFAKAIADARAGLKRLIEIFDDPDQPYAAYPVPGHEPRFDDYAHLARVREWSAGGAEDGGEG